MLLSPSLLGSISLKMGIKTQSPPKNLHWLPASLTLLSFNWGEGWPPVSDTHPLTEYISIFPSLWPLDGLSPNHRNPLPFAL